MPGLIPPRFSGGRLVSGALRPARSVIDGEASWLTRRRWRQRKSTAFNELMDLRRQSAVGAFYRMQVSIVATIFASAPLIESPP